MKVYFISGIGTDTGKTIVSAILVEKLKANYWKPIQTGALIDSDTTTVKRLVSNEKSVFFKEAISLEAPLSPHEAAEMEKTSINLRDIKLPKSDDTLIIEGAGGLMVPLNNTELMIDLIKHFNAELILVSRNYLGSINHTLMCLEVIRIYKIPFKGIVFCGQPNKASEDIILSYSKTTCLGHVPWLDPLNEIEIKRAGTYIFI